MRKRSLFKSLCAFVLVMFFGLLFGGPVLACDPVGCVQAQKQAVVVPHVQTQTLVVPQLYVVPGAPQVLIQPLVQQVVVERQAVVQRQVIQQRVVQPVVVQKQVVQKVVQQPPRQRSFSFQRNVIR